MRRAYPVAAVRAAETALMATLPEGTLMARAADGLARTCLALLHGAYGARVVLLVGSGDNGGDALYAGALLARRGARVDAIVVSGRAHPAGLRALAAAGGRVVALAPGDFDAGPFGQGQSAAGGPGWTAPHGPEPQTLLARADLVVDGVVGIGGRGPLRPAVAALVQAVDRGDAWRVAVDLPSGVDADTGAVPGAVFTADVTVTFGTAKPGLLVTPGATVAGVLEVVDIGLGPWLAPPSPGSGDVAVLETGDVAASWPVPAPADDKYTRGVVGVVAGSTAYPGAAVLCVGAALRAGAGMVRYDGPAADQVSARWPEAVLGPGRVQALVVGPGLGTGADATRRVRSALESQTAVLVDADGLTVLAENTRWLSARAERGAVTVLTPHDREFSRFGRPVGPDRVQAARWLAASLGATVLLKGATTVVAQPDGRATVNPTGTAWLATAGSGDVLAGITGALLAAGLGPDAPACAAFVHGLAGRLAAAGAPATALDVAESVPAAVAAILAGPGAQAPADRQGFWGVPGSGARRREHADHRDRIAR